MPLEPQRQATISICECQPMYLLYLTSNALIYTNPPFKWRGKIVFYLFSVTTHFGGRMDSKLSPRGSMVHLPLDSLRLYTKARTFCIGSHESSYVCWNIRDKEDDSCKVFNLYM